MDSIHRVAEGNRHTIYMGGEKVFTVGTERDGYVSLVPVTFKTYRRHHPGASKDDYETHVRSWANKYEEALAERCRSELRRATCYDKVKEVAPRAARELDEAIEAKCLRSVPSVDVYW